MEEEMQKCSSSSRLLKESPPSLPFFLYPSEKKVLILGEGGTGAVLCSCIQAFPLNYGIMEWVGLQRTLKPI